MRLFGGQPDTLWENEMLYPGVGWWVLVADMWGVRRAAAGHALHRRAAKVRPVDTSPSSSFLLLQEQRESGQAEVEEVVVHVELEEEKDWVGGRGCYVVEVFIGCCSAAGVW